MVKQERFVVITKAQLSDGEIHEIVIKSFDYYPNDKELQELWEEMQESTIYNRIYFVRVEKQTRFEEE